MKSSTLLYDFIQGVGVGWGGVLVGLGAAHVSFLLVK